MKTWVKLYTEIMDDPDVGSLSWAHRGMFMALLALAGKLDGRDGDDMETGRLDSLERVAWHLRCAVDELEGAVTAFTERGFLETRDGIVYLVHYPDRQAHSPSEDRNAVAARVKRFRERQVDGGNENVTPLQRQGNEGVTQLEKRREEKTRVEEEKIVRPRRHIDHDPHPEIVELHLMYQAFQRGAGYEETDALPAGRARDGLRRMVDEKRSYADVEGCTRWLKTDDFWSRKTIPIGQVADALPEWLKQGRPLECQQPKHNGRRPQHSQEAIPVDVAKIRADLARIAEKQGATNGGIPVLPGSGPPA